MRVSLCIFQSNSALFPCSFRTKSNSVVVWSIDIQSHGLNSVMKQRFFWSSSMVTSTRLCRSLEIGTSSDFYLYYVLIMEHEQAQKIRCVCYVGNLLLDNSLVFCFLFRVSCRENCSSHFFSQKQLAFGGSNLWGLTLYLIFLNFWRLREIKWGYRREQCLSICSDYLICFCPFFFRASNK